MKQKPLNVRWTPAAYQRYQHLTATQQAQVRRLLAALLISPEAGQFWHKDLDNNVVYFVSAYDTHVVYRLIYRTDGDTMLIMDTPVFVHP